MLYRIFTEDMNRNKLHRLVGQYFDGFTSFVAQGFGKGVQEPSRVIEIVAERDDILAIKTLCHEIKRLNDQESVLLQAIELKSCFI